MANNNWHDNPKFENVADLAIVMQCSQAKREPTSKIKSSAFMWNVRSKI